MLLLLNWRLWAAIGVAALLATGGYFVYKSGANSVQVDFDVYKNKENLSALAAESAARAKESTLNQTNQQVSSNYEALKSATATAVLALDRDRMRLQSQLAASHSAASASSAASAGSDAGTQSGVLSQCIDRYASVASDADSLSAQVTGLQSYISKVCLGASK